MDHQETIPAFNPWKYLDADTGQLIDADALWAEVCDTMWKGYKPGEIGNA